MCRQKDRCVNSLSLPYLLFSGVWLGYWLQCLWGDGQGRLAICSWFSSVGFIHHLSPVSLGSNYSALIFMTFIYLFSPVVLPSSSLYLHAGHIMAEKGRRTLCVASDGPGTIKSRLIKPLQCICSEGSQWSQSALDIFSFGLCLCGKPTQTWQRRQSRVFDKEHNNNQWYFFLALQTVDNLVLY